MTTNTLRSRARRHLLAGSAAGLGMALVPWRAGAQGGALRIGFLAPLSGPFAATGRQMEAAARLYVARHGSSVAGRAVELVVKDDTGTADVAKRLAQELLVNDKVHVLAGFGLTPLALAAAPLATQARTPMVVTAAAASSITEASPFIVRSSFTAAQVVTVLADWAAGEGIQRLVSLVTDYAPGADAEKHFNERFGGGGRQVVEALRVPLRSPDFAPFLQRVRDARPEALFAFVPAGVGATLMKQFNERGLERAGIRLIAEGSVTDDDILNTMGDAALGVVTAHHYSAAHPSAANRAFVEAFGAAAGSLRPNFMAVGSWDGMRLVCEAAKAAPGGGAALVEAMKGRSFESPRGPLRIDAATRDVVHNVYVRRVARIGGQLWNQEFATVPNVKDPAKGKG
jgi:branched-chain amino acid transport system substrate-binding protein